MGKRKILDDTETVLRSIVTAMQDKKAKNIISLDLKKISESVADYFVICHGTSKAQVDAIYDNVLDFVKKNCETLPFHKEGFQNSEWILIDYFDVVVHVFREEVRDFYKLEDLWADAKLKTYEILD